MIILEVSIKNSDPRDYIMVNMKLDNKSMGDFKVKHKLDINDGINGDSISIYTTAFKINNTKDVTAELLTKLNSEEISTIRIYK